MWYTNHVIIWYFYHNHHCLQYSCHFFTDFWPVGIFFRTVLCCEGCDSFYLLYWICPSYLDCKLSVSGNEQVQSHDPFPRFFWRYCGSAHDHSCFFPVRVCHFPYAARGKSFPPVPSECQIWLFQRNHNCFIWKRNQIISSVFIVLILMLASSLCMYSVEHDAQPEVFRNAFSGIW